ncbi:hypothetical protein [Geomonas ferrireducens]|uniref:hypothetical protein n=1 Tax=Geomonas ferrireducens TaxID=2570227 RepID=UPI0010A8D4A3|nr:hypothetical protein [Geomonas ferrireducens]
MEAGLDMLEGLNWWQLRQEYLRVRKEIYQHHRDISRKLEWSVEVKRRMTEVDPSRKKKRR